MAHKVFIGAFEAKDDTQGTFSARFATLNVVDHQGDVTVPGAFGKQSVLIEAYGHNDKTLPVGVGEIGEQGNDAVVNGRFFLDTAGGKEHYSTLKNVGPLQQWSYTFEVEDSAPGVFDGKEVRFLRKMHVIAAAPVQRGAGVNTQTLAIKAADKAVTRTEADGEHPAGHYLVVEDPETVTTWHLRVRAVNGDPDHRLMGAAWAALHGGYRGNVYEGPGKTAAIAKLTRMYAAEDMDVPKEKDGKSINLSRQVDTIRSAFMEPFNSSDGSMKPTNYEDTAWPQEIYDDHLIVTWKNELYQVNYRLGDDGKYVFTAQNEWIRGSMVFIAGAKVAKARYEAKAGRVLARRNAERIIAAYNTLTEVLKDAGLLETADSDSDHDGDDGATDKTRRESTLSTGTDKEPQSSTLAARDDRDDLKLLKLYSDEEKDD